MPSVDINYLAVFVAAVINMVVGWIWYSPSVFAKPWAKEAGIKLKDMGGSNANRSFLIAGLGALVQSYILAHFVSYTAADTVVEGALTGFWLWVGFTAITAAVNYAFAGRSLKLWQIDAGYFLVVLLVNGALLANWV
jgi:hypothetical protein